MHDLMFRLARPVLFGFDPETAHRLSLWALKSGLAGSRAGPDDAVLATRVWGLEFPNPVGLAAGFDKDAEAVDALLGIGFGFVEAGTVTPEPQPGNPRPRLFRLADDEAIVNRLGFNSGGLAVFAAHLSRRRGRGGIVGANLGKNRDAPDAVADFVTGARALCALADYLVINVSSPNTPGLRDLQDRAAILNLVDHVRTAMAEAATGAPPPLLVKIAPDLETEALAALCEAAAEARVDGLIVGNTTVARAQDLRGAARKEEGGLSGKPLFAPSTAMLSEVFRLTGGRIPLIGCGGMFSGADAYAKIRAGASLVQLYTAMVFHGPGVAAAVKRELAACLRRDGFASVTEAVGADHA